MPSAITHYQQAQANLGLHEQLVRQHQYPDWALTVLFYAALHYIDACLHPSDPPDHAQRNSYIRRDSSLRSIYPQYRVLFEKSLDARYECYDPKPEELTSFKEDQFGAIESHLLPIMRAKGVIPFGFH